MEVSWREFRADLADYIERVRERNERITITRHGKVVAELCPPSQLRTPFHKDADRMLDTRIESANP
jgi:prevent-host-death family protein